MGKPLIAIVGPTGVGKSSLALELAQLLGGEIVNADSRQVYRGMDIGTAKPSPGERRRVPHHLYDIREPDQEFNLACYLELAHETIEEIQRRGHLPLLVGGTGLYVWGLVEGLRVPHVPPNPELRQRLQRRAEVEGPGALHNELQRVDAEAAARIDPRNVRRTVRALEVYLSTGVPFSKAQRRQPPPFSTLMLGLTMPRAELYRRLDERVEAMVGAGWVGEVQRLLERGCSPELPALSSLGYPELAEHVQGRLSLEEAVARIKTGHHHFARRQYAWFRPGDERIRWLEAGAGAPAAAHALVESYLGHINRL